MTLFEIPTVIPVPAAMTIQLKTIML